MENITSLFDDVYLPESGFVIYRNRKDTSDCYVESFDIGEDGSPLNLHPLSVEESTALAKTLDTSKTMQKAFLKSKGLIPDNVLYLDPSQQGCVIWHSLPQMVDLFFVAGLDIPNGKACIPALIWKATKTELCIYAVKSDGKPDLQMPLYHAPFFNLYKSGKVCMGTVDVQRGEAVSLEDFIESWQQYFFRSYFSHLIESHNPVKANIVQLWQKQIQTVKAFPSGALVKTKLTLKSLIR
jgi:PRTRC genetic system protein B